MAKLSAQSAYHLALEGVEAQNPLSTTAWIGFEPPPEAFTAAGATGIKRRNMKHCWVVTHYDDAMDDGLVTIYPFKQRKDSKPPRDPVDTAPASMPKPLAQMPLTSVTHYHKYSVPEKKAVPFPEVAGGLRHCARPCSATKHTTARRLRSESLAGSFTSAQGLPGLFGEGASDDDTDTAPGSGSSLLMRCNMPLLHDDAAADPDDIPVTSSIALGRQPTEPTFDDADAIDAGAAGTVCGATGLLVHSVDLRRTKFSSAVMSHDASPPRLERQVTASSMGRQTAPSEVEVDEDDGDASVVVDEQAQQTPAGPGSVFFAFRSNIDRDAFYAFITAANAAQLEKTLNKDLEMKMHEERSRSRVTELLDRGRTIKIQNYVDHFSSYVPDDDNGGAAAGSAGSKAGQTNLLRQLSTHVSAIRRDVNARADYKRYGPIGPPPGDGIIKLEYPDGVKMRRISVPKGAMAFVTFPSERKDDASAEESAGETTKPQLCFTRLVIHKVAKGQTLLDDPAEIDLTMPTIVTHDGSKPFGVTLVLEQMFPRRVVQGPTMIPAGSRRRLVFNAASPEAREKWVKWFAAAIGQPHLHTPPPPAAEEADAAADSGKPTRLPRAFMSFCAGKFDEVADDERADGEHRDRVSGSPNASDDDGEDEVVTEYAVPPLKQTAGGLSMAVDPTPPPPDVVVSAAAEQQRSPSVGSVRSGDGDPTCTSSVNPQNEPPKPLRVTSAESFLSVPGAPPPPQRHTTGPPRAGAEELRESASDTRVQADSTASTVDGAAASDDDSVVHEDAVVHVASAESREAHGRVAQATEDRNVPTLTYSGSFPEDIDGAGAAKDASLARTVRPEVGSALRPDAAPPTVDKAEVVAETGEQHSDETSATGPRPQTLSRGVAGTILIDEDDVVTLAEELEAKSAALRRENEELRRDASLLQDSRALSGSTAPASTPRPSDSLDEMYAACAAQASRPSQPWGIVRDFTEEIASAAKQRCVETQTDATDNEGERITASSAVNNAAGADTPALRAPSIEVQQASGGPVDKSPPSSSSGFALVNDVMGGTVRCGIAALTSQDDVHTEMRLAELETGTVSRMHVRDVLSVVEGASRLSFTLRVALDPCVAAGLESVLSRFSTEVLFTVEHTDKTVAHEWGRMLEQCPHRQAAP